MVRIPYSESRLAFLVLAVPQGPYRPFQIHFTKTVLQILENSQYIPPELSLFQPKCPLNCHSSLKGQASGPLSQAYSFNQHIKHMTCTRFCGSNWEYRRWTRHSLNTQGVYYLMGMTDKQKLLNHYTNSSSRCVSHKGVQGSQFDPGGQ